MNDLARAESILRAACGDRAAHPNSRWRRSRPSASEGPPRSTSSRSPRPTSSAASRAIADAGVDYTVIGKGSNVLVSDLGFEGLVLRLGRGYRWAARDGDRVTAGGSMPLPALAGVALAPRARRTGVRRRDPCFVGRSGQDERGRPRRTDVDVRRRGRGLPTGLDGTMERLDAAAAGFAYRRSDLAADAVVVGATALFGRATRQRSARRWTRRAYGVDGPSRSPSPTAEASSSNPARRPCRPTDRGGRAQGDPGGQAPQVSTQARELHRGGRGRDGRGRAQR